MSAFRPLARSALLPRTQKRTLARMTLIGRLAAQPEVHTTAAGRDILRYALAVNSGNRENSETSFFRISSFPVSEVQKNLLAGLEKGQQLFVECDGKMGSFEVDGQTRRQLQLVQRSFELLQKPASQRDHTDQAAGAMSAGAEAGDEAVR